MAAPEPAVPPDGAVDAGVLEPEPPHAASEKARQKLFHTYFLQCFKLSIHKASNKAFDRN